MKILHIASNREWGGGEVYIATLAKEQMNHGHDVEIICANRPEIIKRFKEEGLKVRVMQIHGHLNFITPLKIAGLMRKHGGNAVIHIHRLPDSPVVSHALNLISRAKRPGFVCTHHLIDTPPMDAVLQKAYRSLDCIICVSNKSREHLLSIPSTIDPQKVTFILNSTKTKIQHINNPLLSENKSEDINLLYIGRFYPEKGVDTLIEAIALTKGASLTLCGKGSDNYTNTLIQLINRLGLQQRINIIGFTDNVAEYIAKSDIGVIPSRWEEPCALVNFEFLACGKPLVTSNTGGQPEIITDGVDGLLVPPDNPKALADAINKLILDPELRSKMGNAARETFERRFTYDKFYSKVMDVYQRALAHRH